MKIMKGIFIVKNLMLFGVSGLLFLTSLGYFLGWETNIETLTIYVIIIISEIAVFSIAYFTVRKTRKKFFEFNEKKQIFLVTKKGRKYMMSLEDIRQMFYARFFWTFFMQFGSGYLHIEYKDDQGDMSQYEISMSLKDVKNIEKMYKIKIAIK